MDRTRRLDRRQALILLGGGGAAAFGLPRLSGLSGGTPAAQAATCVLTPEVTEGPYWVENRLTRRDVTGGQRGAPLRLRLRVQDATTCRAIGGADVEIWHANAAGDYSGVQGNTRRWLRGHQRADAAGVVLFDTVYPGWYSGRTPHIHLKVHAGGTVVHTGQLFFPERVSRFVYARGVYAPRGQADVANASDGIYRQAGGSRAQLALARQARDGGWVGRATLGVHRA